MKLYYNPRSRATITEWILKECGAEHTLVHIDMEKGEHKQADFLKINPTGKLPALVDGESKIFESSAIGIYLGDKFADAGVAPQMGSPLRGRYLSLMVYATTQLEPAMSDAFLNHEPSASKGWTSFEEAQKVVAKEIGEGPYLFGEQFTLADILIGSIFIWRRMFGKNDEHPIIKSYIDRLLERPHAIKFS